MARIRIVRIVTRLNIGGPTAYLMALTKALDPSCYDQWLVSGVEGPLEGSMQSRVAAAGIHPILIPEMVGVPSLGIRDARALQRIRHLLRRVQPDIVETHLSKAGILGRLAARLEGVPSLIHVFHGHVLSGYYGPLKTSLARWTESTLARRTDRLLAVSAGVKAELTRYGVAAAGRFTVVEPALPLDALIGGPGQRGRFRRDIGVDGGTRLVGIVARLSPIKNHELFLDAARIVSRQRPDVRFVVVGDGPLRAAVEARAGQLGVADRMTFTGWRHDLPSVYADLDLAVLCSNNEGTPFALIEAMAAGCPVVATRVGGVPDIVADHKTGLLVPPRSGMALADAILRLLGNPELASRLASAARCHAKRRFAATRLARDMDFLYQSLLRRSNLPAVSPSIGIERSRMTAR
jgi:glycosyltransferase involved in cell wall biosynthesis